MKKNGGGLQMRPGGMQMARPHHICRDGGRGTEDLYVKRVVVIEEEDEGRKRVSVLRPNPLRRRECRFNLFRGHYLLYRICLIRHLLHRIPHPRLLWLRISTQ